MSDGTKILGFIGGTGPEGRGLALRFALAGDRVLIGSRDPKRATDAAEAVSAQVRSGQVTGAINLVVAAEADIVFIAVPFEGHRDTLAALREPLAGKVIVDVVAPLAFSKGQARAVPVDEGSVALQARVVLKDSIVAAAFQTISARDLLAPDRAIDSDVVVCADDTDARRTVMALAEKIDGVRAVDGGGLENARYVEDFTALLLNINRIYNAHSAIKITGISRLR